jgi:hypothetical protein
MDAVTAVLIIFFVYGYAGGSTSTGHKDMAACRAAEMQVHKDLQEQRFPKAFTSCVAK